MSVALKVLTSMRACSGDVCHETRLAARVCQKTHLDSEVEPMSIALKTSTALSANSVCVSQTHMASEVEPMSVALKTSTALSACSVCVSQTHMVYEVGPAHVCQKAHLM